MATYPLKKYRLTKKGFILVLKNGRAFKEDGMLLKILKDDRKEKKIGFLVSKKIVKKATQRNKIKRILRDIVRSKIENIKEGTKIVVIVLKQIDRFEVRRLKEHFERLLKLANVIED